MKTLFLIQENIYILQIERKKRLIKSEELHFKDKLKKFTPSERKIKFDIYTYEYHHFLHYVYLCIDKYPIELCERCGQIFIINSIG